MLRGRIVSHVKTQKDQAKSSAVLKSTYVSMSNSSVYCSFSEHCLKFPTRWQLNPTLIAQFFTAFGTHKELHRKTTIFKKKTFSEMILSYIRTDLHFTYILNQEVKANSIITFGTSKSASVKSGFIKTVDAGTNTPCIFLPEIS